MLTVLFLINIMAGALIIARGRELRRKGDPSLLTGTIKDHVNDPSAYTRVIGLVELAFGIIMIVLAGLMITLGDWLALLIGDIALAVVFAAAIKLINRRFLN